MFKQKSQQENTKREFPQHNNNEKKMLSKLTARWGLISANFYDSTRAPVSSPLLLCFILFFFCFAGNGEKLFMAINISEIYDCAFSGSHVRARMMRGVITILKL